MDIISKMNNAESMRKTFIFTIIAMAAMTFVACAKHDVNQDVKQEDLWKKVTLTVQAPSTDDLVETKVSSNGTQGTQGNADFRYKFKWDAGDIITIYSITPTTKDEYTSWGNYVTDEGGASADFAGNMPVSYVGSKLIGMHSKYTDEFKVYWNNSRTDFGYNIPATQDGTGFKYAAYAGMNSGASSGWYDSENNKVIISGYDSKAQWQLISALSRFHVDASYNIKRVTITASYSNGDEAYLVSNGGNKDIYFASNNLFTCWGGGANTVTIENGGSVLPEDIFFASRNTANKTATGGYYFIKLTFTFTNTEDKTATKVIKLGTGITGNVATAVTNIDKNVINNFGTVPFKDGDFK